MRIKFSSPADSPRIGNFSKPAAPREIPPGYPPYVCVCGGGKWKYIFILLRSAGGRVDPDPRRGPGHGLYHGVLGRPPRGGMGPGGKNTVDSITDRCRRAAVYHNILTIHPSGIPGGDPGSHSPFCPVNKNASSEILQPRITQRNFTWGCGPGPPRNPATPGRHGPRMASWGG